MTSCYAKTDAGREEIRNPSKRLSRVMRNILLIIDELHPGSNWVQLVHGATERDLETLLSAGLITEKVPDPKAPSLPSTQTLVEALSRLSYDQLYDLLTSQARDRIGLLRSFSFVLRIERCANVDELRALALEFLKLVREHQSQAAARQICLALGADVA